MGVLNTKERNALPAKTFAGPGRSYPIPDKGHAIAAESDATKFASPAVKAKVDAAVHNKFPDLGHGRARAKQKLSK